MMKITTLILLALVLGAIAAVPTYAATSYAGTLVWTSDSSSQITAYNDWAAPTTQMSWAATNFGSYWLYSYTFSVARKDISHMIIETSGSEQNPIVLGTGHDVWDFVVSGGAGNPSTDSPKQWDSTQPSNPNMPSGGMYGIKFDSGTTGTAWTISFKANRRPVWGDFYAKSGSDEVAYNAGFTGGAFDGTNYVSLTNWSTDQIGVPDTTAVPEPGTILAALSILGPAGFLFRRRK